MNQINLLQKLAPLGVAAFGAIAFTAAPAQALSLIPSELDFDFTASDIDDGFVLGGNLIDWSITDIDDVDGGGILATPIATWPGLPSLPDLSNPAFVDLPTGIDFTAGFAITPNIWRYTNDQEIVIGFNQVTIDGTTDTLEYVIDAGSDFDVIANGNINFVLDPGASDEVSLRFDGMTTTGNGEFQFGEVRGATESGGDGEFVATGVPEPASILGLLTVGGLGLGLKRKKQS